LAFESFWFDPTSYNAAQPSPSALMQEYEWGIDSRHNRLTPEHGINGGL